MTSVTELQERWNTLYKTTLPRLAKAKDLVQPHWPVVLDHCFGRIILDNAVGVTKPWAKVIKSPAYKNMTARQLEDAIMLGESIAVGEANLEELNHKSLELREKNGPAAARRGQKRAHEYNSTVENNKKSKSAPMKSPEDDDGGRISSYFRPSPRSETTTDVSKQTEPESKQSTADPRYDTSPSTPQEQTEHPKTSRMNPIMNETYPDASPLELIQSSNITQFRKQVLTLLCQVPRGKHTTYAALSDHISATTHKTCARAVGNAMRNNPFAPVVPCHRVLAHDGKIGGFGGHWGEEGKYAGKKKEMLREEGVKFDGSGKVVGAPFRGFK
ncbi:hypothetical protein MBLNU457_1774t1 [Dothideomycetes sp. NU457]